MEYNDLRGAQESFQDDEKIPLNCGTGGSGNDLHVIYETVNFKRVNLIYIYKLFHKKFHF
jgi:hypothetical protein